MKVLALIPARSGSKTVPDKNILPIGGKPMLVHSINHANAAKTVDRVIVTTDSDLYANIATTAGAECPFMRPAEFSGDSATDLETFQHALRWLQVNENYRPDLVVHLRPTHPIRDPRDIDCMVEELRNNTAFDSIRSVSLSSDTPYKMWFSGDNERLTPVIKSEISEAYNLPRQDLPEVYIQNASIDVIRLNTIMTKNSMTGDYIQGYKMTHFFDIDTEDEFNRAKLQMGIDDFHGTPKQLVFDIDGVICSIVTENDYNLATPLPKNIQGINTLYSKGHRIVLFTARGYVTGRDWEATTKNQLDKWGVKYHSLHFGKPNADFYIDDKLISIRDIINLTLKNYE